MPKVVDHDGRREELARAASQSSVATGSSTSSVRSVAAEAGVSAGSLRYYFPSQAELIAFAMDLVEARTRDRIAGHRPDGHGPRARHRARRGGAPPRRRAARGPRGVVRADRPRSPRSGPARGERPRVRRPARPVASRGRRAALAGLTADGIDTELEAVRLHALLDGLAVHLDLHPERLSTDTCRAVLRHHLDTLTT